MPLPENFENRCSEMAFGGIIECLLALAYVATFNLRVK